MVHHLVVLGQQVQIIYKKQMIGLNHLSDLTAPTAALVIGTVDFHPDRSIKTIKFQFTLVHNRTVNKNSKNVF